MATDKEPHLHKPSGESKCHLPNHGAVYRFFKRSEDEYGTRKFSHGLEGNPGLYEVKEYATYGEMLEMIRSQTANFAGEEAAKMIYATVTFEIYEVRQLVDFGQCWDKSI